VRSKKGEKFQKEKEGQGKEAREMQGKRGKTLFRQKDLLFSDSLKKKREKSRSVDV